MVRVILSAEEIGYSTLTQWSQRVVEGETKWRLMAGSKSVTTNERENGQGSINNNREGNSLRDSKDTKLIDR